MFENGERRQRSRRRTPYKLTYEPSAQVSQNGAFDKISLKSDEYEFLPFLSVQLKCCYSNLETDFEHNLDSFYFYRYLSFTFSKA